MPSYHTVRWVRWIWSTTKYCVQTVSIIRHHCNTKDIHFFVSEELVFVVMHQKHDNNDEKTFRWLMKTSRKSKQLNNKFCDGFRILPYCFDLNLDSGDCVFHHKTATSWNTSLGELTSQLIVRFIRRLLGCVTLAQLKPSRCVRTWATPGVSSRTFHGTFLVTATDFDPGADRLQMLTSASWIRWVFYAIWFLSAVYSDDKLRAV